MQQVTHKVLIDQGKVIFVYEEKIADLMKQLGFEFDGCRRVSNVEPEGDRWCADLSLVGGPKLGPFDKRSEALQAEVAWVEAHLADILRDQQRS